MDCKLYLSCYLLLDLFKKFEHPSVFPVQQKQVLALLISRALYFLIPCIALPTCPSLTTITFLQLASTILLNCSVISQLLLIPIKCHGAVLSDMWEVLGSDVLEHQTSWGRSVPPGNFMVLMTSSCILLNLLFIMVLSLLIQCYPTYTIYIVVK